MNSSVAVLIRAVVMQWLNEKACLACFVDERAQLAINRTVLSMCEMLNDGLKNEERNVEKLTYDNEAETRTLSLRYEDQRVCINI